MTKFNLINPLNSVPNHFGYSCLQRKFEIFDNSEWLEQIFQNKNIKVVPLWEDKNLFSEIGDKITPPLPCYPKIQEFMEIVNISKHYTFLGYQTKQNKDMGYLAIDLSHLNEIEINKKISKWGNFYDLRNISPLIKGLDGSILAYARAIVTWHKNNGYCGKCGSKTLPIKLGHQRNCTNKICNKEHFPRTDPAVIMLVHNNDKTLLGRQKLWPAGMYSTLAGFVEPGETLENAVAREVHEEAGVKVKNIQYHSSQPWPFPSSLMMGFFAEAQTSKIKINTEEIEDVKWFSKKELLNFSDQQKFLPRKLSISRRLIEDWINF